MRFAFSYPDPPAACGLELTAGADAPGWFLTFDRVRGTMHLAASPRLLDDFWADLVGRADEPREVDGPRVAEAPLRLAHGQTITGQILLDRGILEIYVDAGVVLTHRLPGPVIESIQAFAVDGLVECEVETRSI